MILYYYIVLLIHSKESSEMLRLIYENINLCFVWTVFLLFLMICCSVKYKHTCVWTLATCLTSNLTYEPITGE